MQVRQLSMLKIQSFGMTDIGMKRKVNQDCFLVDDSLQLYVVADGMGGHRAGEVASQLAIEELKKFVADNSMLDGREMLVNGINRSCTAIYQKAKENEDLAGMGTTVLALIFQSNCAFIGQVGDSRAYLINPHGVWQLTEDHSLLNEELRSGRLASSQVANYQFKNVITRSVGYESHVNVDVYRRNVYSDDSFLLCTDGLSGLVEIEELQKEIRAHGIEQGVRNLVSLANQRGGDDNITALACHVELTP